MTSFLFPKGKLLRISKAEGKICIAFTHSWQPQAASERPSCLLSLPSSSMFLFIFSVLFLLYPVRFEIQNSTATSRSANFSAAFTFFSYFHTTSWLSVMTNHLSRYETVFNLTQCLEDVSTAMPFQGPPLTATRPFGKRPRYCQTRPPESSRTSTEFGSRPASVLGPVIRILFKPPSSRRRYPSDSARLLDSHPCGHGYSTSVANRNRALLHSSFDASAHYRHRGFDNGQATHPVQSNLPLTNYEMAIDLNTNAPRTPACGQFPAPTTWTPTDQLLYESALAGESQANHDFGNVLLAPSAASPLVVGTVPCTMVQRLGVIRNEQTAYPWRKAEAPPRMQFTSNANCFGWYGAAAISAVNRAVAFAGSVKRRAVGFFSRPRPNVPGRATASPRRASDRAPCVVILERSIAGC